MHGSCQFAAAIAALFIWLQVAAAQTPAPSAAPTLTVDSTGNEPRKLLEYKFEPGQFSHYEVVNTSTLVSQFNEFKEKVRNESKAWKQYRVVSVDEQGSALLEPVVQRVLMTATFNDADKITYDSTKSDEPPRQFQSIANTVGKPVARVLAKPNGALQKVTLLDGAPEHLAANANDPHVNFLTVLPTEPIGVGATWRDRFQVPVTVSAGLTQNVTLQRTYQLTEFVGNVAMIAVKTSVITPINNPQIEMQLMQRTSTGQIEFDLAAGRLLSQKTASANTVVGPFNGQGQVQSSMETVERWLPGPAGVEPAKLETTSAQQ